MTPHNNKKGQAAVAVLIFMSVLIVSGLAVYKSGKLTTDKMQLQNAADAAAYSMSTVEARDLNFASYMNRAIVANEVGVGQLVGLASWAFHWRSFADFLMAYDTCCLGPATLGISTPIMQSITNIAWRIPGEAFINVLSPIANIGTTVLHNINRFYGLAEYGYHVVAVIFALGVLDEMIKQNGPPGAKISDFGIVALIAHIATYGALPNLPGDQFTNSYSPTKKMTREELEQGGYGRLAALIRDSRDPFTKGRGWELRPPGFPLDISTPDSAPFVVDLGILAYEFKLTFHMDLSLERKGASELRIVLPKSAAASNLSAANFNWSSADATGLFFELNVCGGAKIELLPDPFRFTIFNAGVCGYLANGRFIVRVSFGQTNPDDVQKQVDKCVAENKKIKKENDADKDISNDKPLHDCTNAGGKGLTLVDVPFPTGAPFGAGFAQAGKNTPNKLTVKEMNLADLGGPIEHEHYGEAPKNQLAWLSPGPTGPLPPVGVMASTLPVNDPRTRVNKTYGGLPHYIDTTGNKSFLGIGAPNLIIGLVLDEDDFDKNAGGTGKQPEPSGRFGLTEKLADGELAVIAKSELYFSRPTDLSYFARADGQEEYGSAFNPYWQVRLIDSSYSDRILALLIQQKQDFIKLGDTFQLYFKDIMSYLPGGGP